MEHSSFLKIRQRNRRRPELLVARGEAAFFNWWPPVLDAGPLRSIGLKRASLSGSLLF
jgi:hypothetical protein